MDYNGDRRQDNGRNNGGYDRKPHRNSGQSFDRNPRGNGDRRFDGRTFDRNQRDNADRRYGEPSYDRKPGRGDDRSFSDRRYGERSNDRDFRDNSGRRYGERSYDRKPGREESHQYSEHQYDERSFDRGFRDNGSRSYGERSYDRKPGRGSDRPYDKRRSSDRRYGERSYDRNPGDGRDRQHGGYRPDDYFAHRTDDEAARPASAEIVNAENTEMELPNIIMGRNPVKEAIKSGRSIDRILVVKEHDGSLGEIVTLAHEANLVIREVERAKLDEICMPFGHNGKSGNHQGIVAEIPGVEYAELADILEYAEVRGEKPFVVLLDGIEDPHNLGSIIRSAECAGAHGVVITKRRSASVTAAVVKTSAGAAEHMRIARVVNLANAIDTLKEKGLWIAGADMDGRPMYDVDMKGGFALVIGSEGSGLSKLVKEKCDFLVSVPLKGHIDSLNAAVAGAIIMFEKNRQERGN